jgi:hypothetical protein
MLNHLHLSRPATLIPDVGRRRLWLLIGAAAVAAALAGSAGRPIGAGAAKEIDHQVSGAGRMIYRGRWSRARTSDHCSGLPRQRAGW